MTSSGARAELLRAQLAAGAGRRRDAPTLLIKAAKRLEPLHPGLAGETLPGRVLRRAGRRRLATRGHSLKSRPVQLEGSG